MARNLKWQTRCNRDRWTAGVIGGDTYAPGQSSNSGARRRARGPPAGGESRPKVGRMIAAIDANQPVIQSGQFGTVV